MASNHPRGFPKQQSLSGTISSFKLVTSPSERISPVTKPCDGENPVVPPTHCVLSHAQPPPPPTQKSFHPWRRKPVSTLLVLSVEWTWPPKYVIATVGVFSRSLKDLPSLCTYWFSQVVG